MPMRSASHPYLAERPQSLFRRRTTALALVIAAHVGLVIMLLRLAPPPTAPVAPAVTAIELLPDPEARSRTVEKHRETRKQAERRERVPPPPPPLPYQLEGVIPLTRAEFAAADIARMPSHPREAPAAEAAESASAESAARGPNGERLYNAQWYREPTQAELSYYLPGGASGVGWAMIACQTVENYRVDNCVELGQSPAGSGLASAIRQAAWQFRVLPPRIGGRPLVGAWVRIRIEFGKLPPA
jgi:protein TonB